jgi:hypothetical protein
METDLNYFSRRAEEERAAGLAAASVRARMIHLEIAAAYEKRVRDLTAQKKRSMLRLVAAA